MYAKRKFYKLVTSILFVFCLRAFLSCDCTHPIPLSRIAFESDICMERKRPFFFKITRTDNIATARSSNPVTISNVLSIVYPINGMQSYE